MAARLLLTVLVLIFFLFALYGMWRGWKGRATRQAQNLPEFLLPPEGAGDAEPLLPPATGVYVGSTTAGDWQDRIAVGDVGHRAEATLRLSAEGLIVERVGASPLWIPAESIQDARTAQALAGKVMGADGLLVVTWQLGKTALDTGFRGDDKTEYQNWTTALQTMASANRRTAE